MTLTQESPGTDKGIVALEGAACSLYKALQATKETGASRPHRLPLLQRPRTDHPARAPFVAPAVGDMQAAMERSGEYQSYNAQFCKRLSDYMAIMFKFQVRRPRAPCCVRGAALLADRGLRLLTQADEIMADKSRSAPGGIPSVLGHDKMEANLIKYSGVSCRPRFAVSARQAAN